MSDTSVVQILHDVDGDGSFGLDITNHALIARAVFNAAANAQPGTCEIVLRDLDRVLSFVAGRRLKLIVDGVPMWSGFLLLPGRGNFFPAGDARTPTKTRSITLRGTDNNILLDKRYLRRPADYLKAIPNITTDTFDGAILRGILANYADMPDWLDISTYIDDVVVPASAADGHISATHPWAYQQQGTKLRASVDDLALFSAAVFYIGPDDAFHYHAVQDRESPWGFSDRPNKAPITVMTGFEGAYYGFRELNADEDGSDLATDALVWGGSEFAGSGGTVFSRATDATLEALHGKWQLAETHFGQQNFKTQTAVDIRANMIVFGNPTGDASGAEPGTVAGEGPRGLRFSQWAYNFAWHTTNVPLLSGVPRHIYPGDIVPIQLWAFSLDEGVTPFTKILPLRQMRISFPTGAKDGTALVRFEGGFDLRNLDSKFLWSYLRKRQTTIGTTTLATVGDSSTQASYGSLGTFTPTPAPDNSTTVFTVPFGYIPGTTQVYLNGLRQRLGTDYDETDPDAGTITFTSAPLTTDAILVVDRTLAG